MRDAGVVEGALDRLHLVELPTPHRDRPALAVEVAALVLIILDRAEVGQALGPGPALIAGELGPAIEVAGGAADGDAGVDGRRAADELAAWERGVASGHEAGVEAPIVGDDGRLVDAVDVGRERLQGGEVGPGVEQQD